MPRPRDGYMFVTVSLTHAEHAAFQDVANGNHRSMSDQLRAWIDEATREAALISTPGV